MSLENRVEKLERSMVPTEIPAEEVELWARLWARVRTHHQQAEITQEDRAAAEGFLSNCAMHGLEPTIVSLVRLADWHTAGTCPICAANEEGGEEACTD